MLIEDTKTLEIDDLIQVSRNHETVMLAQSSLEKIQASHRLLEKILADDQPVYGINTGFGIFSDKRIPEEDIIKLNRNLIISHAVATGQPLPEDVVRAAMLVRANTLAKGYSGVRPVVIQTLIDMLNKGVTPIVPSQGSLGSSGDLCLLSHLALVLSKDLDDKEEESGCASINGNMYSGKRAMEKANLERIILGPKEGLALNNGATFSAAVGALAIHDSEYLLRVAEIAAALTMEALCACSAALDERIHHCRNQNGQIITAMNIRALLHGSTFIDSTDRIQDAYSIRCAPQVQGAIRDTINYVKTIIEREINAVTDNPLIFEPGEAISGGNFHGEPVGLAMDYLSICLAELGAISERRTFRLTDEHLSGGLPPMLVDPDQNAGLNSGLMLPQYTAASLVLENQTLATPDSIKSLPTSANQEDHNANAMTAARHALEISNNLRQILSIEIFTAVYAIDLRLKERQGQLGSGTKVIFEKIRSMIPYRPGDTLWGPELAKINTMIVERLF